MADWKPEFPIRWGIARWLDNSRWLCWARLALFGMGYWFWPWQFEGISCRRESEKIGCCWCGKFCNKKRMAELYGKQEQQGT